MIYFNSITRLLPEKGRILFEVLSKTGKHPCSRYNINYNQNIYFLNRKAISSLKFYSYFHPNKILSCLILSRTSTSSFLFMSFAIHQWLKNNYFSSKYFKILKYIFLNIHYNNILIGYKTISSTHNPLFLGLGSYTWFF